MLEAGRNLDIKADFSGELKRKGLLPTRIDRALKGQHIQVRCPNLTVHTSQFYVNDRQNPYVYPGGKPFYWIRGRQEGGRLHTWARAALRFSDEELIPSRHGKAGADWPLHYRELEPYYDKVESFLGLVGEKGSLAHLPDGKYSEPMPLTGAERQYIAKKGPRPRGVRPVSGRIIAHNPRRTPLALLAARETGNLTHQPNAAVSHLLINKVTGRAEGVGYIDCITRRATEVKAPAVVLCASAFESVRILLNSACAKHPDGVGNSSGLLGQCVSDHLMIGLKGSTPAGTYQHEAYKKDDPYDFGVPGMYLSVPAGGTGPSASSAFGIQCGIGRGSPTWWMLAFGEMAMSEANRVTIDPAKKDAWGIPAVRIDCAHTEVDRAQIAAMRQTLEELVEEEKFKVQMPYDEKSINGLAFRAMKRVIFSPSGAFWPGASIHEVGGARMGADRKSSVLNRFNQCWDAPNVFVCDGAAFVTSGYQNHTLTIMAMTIRACEQLVAASKKGEL